MRWCIYAVIFAAPFSKSISEAAIALAIILWLSKKIINRDYSLIKTDLNIPFLLFVILIIPSFFNAWHTLGLNDFLHLSVKAFFTKTLKYVFLYFIVIDVINTKSKLKDLFIIAFLSIAIIMIDGFVQYYYAWSDGLHKYPSFKFRFPYEAGGFFRGFPTASFPFPNDLAAWILLTLFPLAAVTIFDLKNNKTKYLTAMASIGLFYLFFLAKARGAWIGLTVSAIYIALSKNKKWIILLIMITIALPFILKMEMSQYVFSFSSLGDRFDMWGTGWEIFKNHPIIGNGLNTFFVNFKKYRNDEWKDKKGSYAHNCYLQMAADTGIIGLGGFAWLSLSYFLSIVKGLKNIKDEFYGAILWGMSIGIFAFLIHSFFDTNLYSLNLVTLFWTAIAVSQAGIKVFQVETHE